MELELVTFEQAKALKELGFPQNIYTSKVYLEKTIPHDIIAKECGLGDWQCICGKLIPCSSDYNKYGVDTCSCPSIELAAKWLREEKNILIEPHAKVFATNGFFKCFVLNCNKVYTKGAEHQIWWTDFGGDNVCFPNWETALSAGIDKAIELLKEE